MTAATASQPSNPIIALRYKLRLHYSTCIHEEKLATGLSRFLREIFYGAFGQIGLDCAAHSDGY
jgi:hypothetical protein